MIGRPFFYAVAFVVFLLLAGTPGAAIGHANAAIDAAAPGSLEYWIRQNAVVAALIAATVALFGHLIAVWTNLLARTYSARIEVAIACEFLPPQGDSRPIELRFLIANKGGARSRFSRIQFRVLGIKGDGPLIPFENDLLSPERGIRLGFPEKIVKADFVSPADEWLFVDPGTTQGFTYPTMIPTSLSLILVHVKLKPMRGHTYTEERVFRVSEPHTGHPE